MRTDAQERMKIASQTLIACEISPQLEQTVIQKDKILTGI
jgi:hypothetical protein